MKRAPGDFKKSAEMPMVSAVAAGHFGAALKPPVPDAPQPLWSSEDPLETLRRWSRSDDRSAARAAIARLTSRLIADTGRGLQLSGADLTGLDLRGFDLRAANLNRAALHGARLDEADLTGASLICTGMERTSFRAARLTGAYVHSLAAQVTCFDDADLSGLVDATGALFHGCSMARARLTDAVLAGTTFYQCTLTKADLTGARLQGATINECHASGAGFREADVTELTVTKSCFDGVTFTDARGEGLVLQRLTGAEDLSLAKACLPRLRLHHVKSPSLDADGLDAADADWCDVHAPHLRATAARLSGASIRRSMLAKATFERASLDHAFVRHTSLDGADLCGASAENAVFEGCRLANADLRRFAARCLTWRDNEAPDADLTGAYLYRAMITGDPPRTMVLRNARLTDAVLVQAYVAADLSGADLSRAQLAYARLNQSDLSGATVAGASIYGGSLVKADLTDAHLAGLRGPAFVDRCVGLENALRGVEDEDAAAFAEFVERLSALLAEQRRGST